MRFVDFLKATVLLSAGAATLLAAITLIALTQDVEPGAVYLSAGWWVTAALIGVWLGRRAEANPADRAAARGRARRALAARAAARA